MIAELKPYPAMKDSGVEWLGDVPEHWDVRRLRTIMEMRVSNVDKHTKEDETPVRLCNYVDIYKHDRISQQMNFMRATATAKEIKRFRLEEGDVLITKDSEAWDDIGVPALVTEAAPDLISGYHLALLRPFADELAGGYLLRALQSKGLAYQFHIEAKGVTRYGLSHTGIKSVWLPLPPLPEQAAIVRYLDYVDRRVQRFVQAKQKLIGLLEEEKQAVIHRAVTRGLDLNVPLKDSGVEWLGKVPEHWEVTRLRHVANSVTSGSRGWSSYAADHGPLFIRIANLSRSSLDMRFKDVVRLNLPDTSEVIRTRVQAGDILISITAYIGSIAVVPEGFEEAYISQHVAKCSLRDLGHNPLWIGYVLLSEVGQTHGHLSLYGGTKDGLSLDDVKSYPLLLPPRSEQDRLVAEIQRSTSIVNGVIDRSRREIELLSEYRARLIADVVTGKLDVREVAAKLPEETDEVEPLDEPDALADESNALPEGSG